MTTPKLGSTLPPGLTDMCRRVGNGPLLTSADVTPSHQGLRVIGVFNPAFVELAGFPHLIVRVDERPHSSLGVVPNAPHRLLSVAYFDIDTPGQLALCDVLVPASFDPDREWEFPPVGSLLQTPSNHRRLRSFISHLRLARLSA